MGRPKGSLSRKHHHVIRQDHETGREAYSQRVQTLAAAWADVRQRAARAPLDRWRVVTCPGACRFSYSGAVERERAAPPAEPGLASAPDGLDA